VTALKQARNANKRYN